MFKRTFQYPSDPGRSSVHCNVEGALVCVRETPVVKVSVLHGFHLAEHNAPQQARFRDFWANEP